MAKCRSEGVERVTQAEKVIRGLEQVKLCLLKCQSGFPPLDELAWQQYIRRLDEALVYLEREREKG